MKITHIWQAKKLQGSATEFWQHLRGLTKFCKMRKTIADVGYHLGNTSVQETMDVRRGSGGEGK